MSEMSKAVLQILKKCVLKTDVVVRGEQLPSAPSNLPITHITQPQFPLQTLRAQISQFTFQIPAFTHANRPIILQILGEEQSLLLKSLHLVLPNSFSLTASFQEQLLLTV